VIIEELDDAEVKDAYCELCNILVGGIKSQCEKKLNLKLAMGIPAIILQSKEDVICQPMGAGAAAIIYAQVAHSPLTLFLFIGLSPGEVE
jgi:hypothetical protein